MVINDRICRKTAGKWVIAWAFLYASGLFASNASAMVVGRCDNCHTMHASQNGANNTEVHYGPAGTDKAYWSGGNLTGGDPLNIVPQERLLKSDCVGCHSSSGTATIVILDNMKVPIVYNTGGYPGGLVSGTDPDLPLAGGNFWGTASGNGNDSWGHNVGGISDKDLTLDMAPGDPGTCNNSCHTDLTRNNPADEPFKYGGVVTNPIIYNGCQGCHNKVAHHKSNDRSYRYLGGHGSPIALVDGGDPAVPPLTNNDYEDADWEQTYSSTDHNTYKNQPTDDDADNIGRFCAGCHGRFHATGQAVNFVGVVNGGDYNTDGEPVATSSPPNPWMRHPTNVIIPNTGEYSQVKGQNYNPLVPVAQDPFGVGSRNLVDTDDQVMCLSCHRAHASNKPDALRFEYATLAAHPTGGGALVNGCFFCHRSKDDEGA